MERAAYSFKDVRFSYPGRDSSFAIEIDDLDIRTGDIAALVGPNGAGKTTLLMILAFLLRPDRGKIEFEGADPWLDAEAIIQARRRAVLVTHHPFLFKGTVGDNLVFGLKIRGEPEPGWTSLVAEALSFVELEGLESTGISTLSAGQAQRVALARAMVLRPRVLLLDEPTANIESGLSSRIEAVIREFSRVKGTTVVLSTHNYSQASRLADKVIFLSSGRRVRFSHENCFSGVAETDGQQSWIEPKPGVRIFFSGAHRGHLTCLINPDSIQILPAEKRDPGQTPNLVAGRVTRLETTEEDMALVRVAGDLVFRATVPLGELRRLGISLSQNVLLRFSPDAVEVARGRAGGSPDD